MKGRLSVKHLLGIKDLSSEDLELIFKTADNFKSILNAPIKKVPSLRDITIVNLFFENSTRTRVSFELAEKRLSADVINFSSSSSSVSKGETLLDTVNNLLAMKVDMVVMRHPAPGACQFLSKHIPAILVNAGDGTHEHPTQALLDAFTLRHYWDGTLEGKKIAIVGDIRHSRVAFSDLLLFKKLGASVRVCGPGTLIPPDMQSTGCEVSYDLDDTLDWCDAVIMLRIQLERQETAYIPSLRDYSIGYSLTLDRLNKLGKSIPILHPGPINRGVEITSEVADSSQSLILNQVENGVAIRMAVLYLLAGVPGS
jgi:aspartate carbamoyltransferase catalytic subunit